MIERRVVRRYAAALYNAASKAGVVDAVESDLGLVSFTVESSPALRELMFTPIVPRKKKQEILADIFQGKIQDVTLAYLNLLIEKNREDALALTEAEYVGLANEARGVVQAEVISAVELDEAQQKRLVKKLNAVTGKKIELATKVDPDVIGGVIVRIGDRVIDGSIRGQLAELKAHLLG
ncbi:MAG: F0F1 ATP synthase subunit delta [Armatimonadota bacterium]|jgi:F-type H+-transporting ATPase subunit delta